MLISVKDVFAAGSNVLSRITSSREKRERERFNENKDLFLMELLTSFRQGNGTAIRPTPGTVNFAYCEALVRDGIMTRDVMSGVYGIKSIPGGDGEGRPC